MSFFLGFSLNNDSIDSVEKIREEVGKVFDGFEIPVRWSKKENYHMTLLYLGNTFPFYNKFLLQHRLKDLRFKRFKVRFNTVKLGISRKYKELIYLDLFEGGEEMRNLLLQVMDLLKVKDSDNFIPHLTLGRVSKELTDQEYSNICRDLAVVTKKLDIKSVEFYIDDVKLMRSEDGQNYVLMNFKDCSSM